MPPCSLHPRAARGIQSRRDALQDGGVRLGSDQCSGPFGLSLAADGAFHGPHLPSAFSLCWLNRAALGTERGFWIQHVPWSRESGMGEPRPGHGAAGLLSCLLGAKHDGNTAGHAGSLLLVPGLTLIHSTLSWTSKEFASKINKPPHQRFCPSLSSSCCPHPSEQKKRFSLMLPGLEFQFPMDATSRSTAQIVLWPLGLTQQ